MSTPQNGMQSRIVLSQADGARNMTVLLGQGKSSEAEVGTTVPRGASDIPVSLAFSQGEDRGEAVEARKKYTIESALVLWENTTS